MLVHRRCARPFALACTTIALAVAPSSALARPAIDASVKPRSVSQGSTVEQAAPIVREIRTEGDSTLALVLSGSALLLAAGGAGLAGRDHRRIGRIA